MRAMASTTFTVGAPLAFRLRDEHRDAARSLRLVFLVRRVRRDGQPPQPRPLGLVLDLADPQGLDRGVVAKLDRGTRAQVVPPHRAPRRAADGAAEAELGPVRDAHPRALAD